MDLSAKPINKLLLLRRELEPPAQIQWFRLLEWPTPWRWRRLQLWRSARTFGSTDLCGTPSSMSRRADPCPMVRTAFLGKPRVKAKPKVGSKLEGGPFLWVGAVYGDPFFQGIYSQHRRIEAPVNVIKGELQEKNMRAHFCWE